MRVFIISEGDDVGGVAIAIQRAFERHGGDDWQVVSMRGTNNYIDYPVWHGWDAQLFQELWAWADVIHAMEKLHNLTPWYNPPGKPLVLHHHGSIYRDNWANFVPVCAEHGITQLASTIDLLAYDASVMWLPNPIPVDGLTWLRSQYRLPPGRVRVTHSPTQRWAKHTEAFLGAYSAIAARYPTDLQLIEGKTWAAANAMRATADLAFDQIAYGYGLSALEGWAMGIPAISGFSDPKARALMTDIVGWAPMYEATVETLPAALEALVSDERLRSEYGERGREYVATWHDERKVVAQLKYIYGRARDEYIPETGPWR